MFRNTMFSFDGDFKASLSQNRGNSLIGEAGKGPQDL
jgi:hypothetical protein